MAVVEKIDLFPRAKGVGRIVVYSETIDIASQATNTVVEQTETVTGAAVGLGVGGGRVSGANQVQFETVNPTAGSVDPASGTWEFVVLKAAT